jgi:hypothetical protein
MIFLALLKILIERKEKSIETLKQFYVANNAATLLYINNN